MSDFFSFLKFTVAALSALFLAFMILLALPKSRLRSVALECAKYVVAGVLFILVPSPIDFLPDLVPGIGWVDDIGYVLGGVAAIKSARGDRRWRLAELDAARRAGSAPGGGCSPANGGVASGLN